MAKLTINKEKRIFEKNSKPFFYLADTIWSAFTNVSDTEWEYYLDYRKAQGFTVLQINTLPQWDRCLVDVNGYPFADEDGVFFDFSQPKEEYYNHAAQMCRVAVEKGFQLALVVLWVNYVPETWGSRICDKNVLSKEMAAKHAEKVFEVFDQFDPIYVVSGDTDFDSPKATSYYQTALEILCEKSPDTLKACHIKRGYDVIPEEMDDKLDFYMYQSGHNRDGQDMTYELAQSFWNRKSKKPIINSEPCYEQMGYSRNLYGRFEKEEVRRAAWQSILSGAYAGITYGAHGIWNWYVQGAPANKMLGEGFDTARSWQEALQFPGAWEYGFLKEFLHDRKISVLTPAQEILDKDTREIRAAVSDTGVYVIYMPVNTKLKLNMDLSDYHFRAMDLDQKRIAHLEVKEAEGKTEIGMHRFDKDVVIWAWKRGEEQ